MKIAIASGKGGTGKTTLAVNLAALWSESEKVVLADIDVEEPNAGLFIGGKLMDRKVISKTVPQWIPEKCQLSEECRICEFNAILELGEEIVVLPRLCHSCHACMEMCPNEALQPIPFRIGVLTKQEKGRLTFIESRLDVGAEQSPPLISKTLDYIDENFSSENNILLDSPPGTSCPAIEAMKTADFIILVTEPTPFGLYDLQLTVDAAEMLEIPFAVVINRCNMGDGSVRKFCSEKQIPIIAEIPNFRKAAEIYSSGGMIYNKIDQFREKIDQILFFMKGIANE